LYTDLCPGNEVASQLRIRSGSGVDALGVTCAKPTVGAIGRTVPLDVQINSSTAIGGNGVSGAQNTGSQGNDYSISCSPNGGVNDIAYDWTAPSSGVFVASTANQAGYNASTYYGTDTAIAVYSVTSAGTVGGEIACNDDNPYAYQTASGSARYSSIAAFTAISGIKYRIVVAAYDGDVNYNLDVFKQATFNGNQNNGGTATWIGASDSINTGTAGTNYIAAGTTVSGGTSFWSSHTLGSTTNLATGPDVTMLWMAPFAGARAIQSQGSAFDTVLAIRPATFTPSTGALTCGAVAGANDDTVSGTTWSKFVYTVTAGSLYCVTLDGYNGAAGAWKVDIR
jgi:hypothetical protein